MSPAARTVSFGCLPEDVRKAARTAPAVAVLSSIWNLL